MHRQASVHDPISCKIELTAVSSAPSDPGAKSPVVHRLGATCPRGLHCETRKNISLRCASRKWRSAKGRKPFSSGVNVVQKSDENKDAEKRKTEQKRERDEKNAPAHTSGRQGLTNARKRGKREQVAPRERQRGDARAAGEARAEPGRPRRANGALDRWLMKRPLSRADAPKRSEPRQGQLQETKPRAGGVGGAKPSAQPRQGKDGDLADPGRRGRTAASRRAASRRWPRGSRRTATARPAAKWDSRAGPRRRRQQPTEELANKRSKESPGRTGGDVRSGNRGRLPGGTAAAQNPPGSKQQRATPQSQSGQAGVQRGEVPG